MKRSDIRCPRLEMGVQLVNDRREKLFERFDDIDDGGVMDDIDDLCYTNVTV